MKKLKLSQTYFAGAEVLSRAQLRKVMGGGTCQVLLPNNSDGGSNFGGMDWSQGGSGDGHSFDSARHDERGTAISGISYDDAQQAVANGGHWCCDSCEDASWAI